MSKKYDMHICSCGRIHMVPMEKLDSALEEDKELLLICGGCGAATRIGADIEPDWNEPNKDCYMMYSRDFSSDKSVSIVPEDFERTDSHKGIREIYYSKGIKVPMETGEYARSYFNGTFSDMWYPDFYMIQRKGITVPEIMEFIDEYCRKRKTVNMDRFIREAPEDMLEEISHYLIRGLNWKGTKWETEWNSR